MILSLAPAVFADGASIVQVAIDVKAPAQGETPEEPSVRLWKKTDQGGASQAVEIPKTDIFIDYRWQESGQGEGEFFMDKFEDGHTYILTVLIDGLRKDYNVNNPTLYLNGAKKTSGYQMSVQGDDVIFTLTFTVNAGDIAPAVAATIDGEIKSSLDKEYDGKDVILAAAVTAPLKGVSYTFQWYKDNKPVAGGARERLILHNVSDSGTYACQVTAASPGLAPRSTNSVPLTVSIKPHPVTLVIEDVEKKSGESDPELVYTVDGDAYDPLEGALVREEGEAKGEYEIDVGTLAFAENVAENYTVTVRKGRFSIVGEGEEAFAPLTDVSDLSYLLGKNQSKVRVSATRGALPQGTVLSLSVVKEQDREKLEEASGGVGIMKSLTVAVTGGEKNELNKNAVLRLLLPLTEEQERYDPATLKALLLKPDGQVEPVEVAREKDEFTGVVYLVVKMTSPGTLAVLKGELLPEEPAEEAAPGETGKGPRKSAGWLWALIIVVALGAAGVIVYVVIRSKKEEEPVKKYTPAPKKNTAPPAPAPSPRQSGEAPAADGGETRAIPAVRPTREAPGNGEAGEPVDPPPVTGRVISFDDLEDD